MPESDQHRLLGSPEGAERDVESHGSEVVVVVNGNGGGGGSGSGKGFRDFLRLSGHQHRHGFKRLDRDDEDRDNNRRDHHHDLPNHSDFDLHSVDPSGDVLGDSAPPEWALLLLGCLLGLATGLLVAAFNKGVCQFFNLFSLFDMSGFTSS